LGKAGDDGGEAVEGCCQTAAKGCGDEKLKGAIDEEPATLSSVVKFTDSSTGEIASRALLLEFMVPRRSKLGNIEA
jgi:hypothetical protein